MDTITPNNPGNTLFKSKAQMEEVLQQAKNYTLAAHLQKI